MFTDREHWLERDRIYALGTLDGDGVENFPGTSRDGLCDARELHP